MFETLTNRLNETFSKIIGKSKLTEDNIKNILREVRIALLEADVALPVVKNFINSVQETAIGMKVIKSLTPSQTFVKIVSSELEKLMGIANEDISLNTIPPAMILITGLQGTGKTTTVAKLAHFLKKRKKKKILLVSLDIYRPAAIYQLELLSKKIDVNFFISNHKTPLAIADSAILEAKIKFFDIVIFDTAGILHNNISMMDELKKIYNRINPVETFFIVDAMTGQDAAYSSKSFNNIIPITGIILTKIDGDARGGAALSVRAITNKPIKFIGVGEDIEALEPFYPNRLASRILGMGDMLSLIDRAEELNSENINNLTTKIKKGKHFTLADFRDQLKQMKKIGGMSSLLEKLPLFGKLPITKNISGYTKELANNQITKIEAIINSMTPQERNYPDIINSSRKRRIAIGSGTNIQDVGRLLKQHKQIKTMMKTFKFKNYKLDNMQKNFLRKK